MITFSLHVNNRSVNKNKAARIVTNSPPRAKRSDMFDKLGWLTVNQLAMYHTLLTVYKVRQASEPEYLSEVLNKDSRNGRIVIPNTRLTLAKKSFTFRGSSDWNALPLDVRSSRKTGRFKTGTRKWISENVARFID